MAEDLDRNQSLAAARALAEEIVATKQPQETFFSEATERFSGQLGSGDLTEIWRQALGLDPRTGLPVGAGS